MFTTYLKSTLRNIRKNKLNAAINLIGLGIGLACCLVIGLYLAGELRYDRFHSRADRIWRVTRSFWTQEGDLSLHLSAVAPPFGPLLARDFPELEAVTRVLQTGGTMRRDNEFFTENNLFYAEPSIFQVFDIALSEGQASTALQAPLEVLLSETAARRYFGAGNPLDRQITLNNSQTYRVTGVYRDLPAASHWHPDMLLSFATLSDTAVYGQRLLETNFGNNAFYTYLLVGRDFDPEKMAARFPGFLDAVMPFKKMKPSNFTRLHLQRLTDIHLHSHLDDEIEPNGDIRRVRTFAVVALVILLIACINYVNLTTAFSLTRAREIGVRKAAGARRGQLVTQFLTESILLALGGMAIGIGLALAALPLLKSALGVTLVPSLLAVWYVPLVLLGAVALVGVLAGLYPAFFLSAFKPVRVLKGDLRTGSGALGLRKGLVVAQFALSIVLLVGTLVITRQLRYMQEKSLGLDQERVVTFAYNTDLARQWEAFRAQLLSSPLAVEAGRSSRQPSTRLLDDLGTQSVQLTDSVENTTATLRYLGVDHHFVPTYGLQLVAGRNFSEAFATDTVQSYLINEAAAEAIGWPTPGDAIGKILNYGQRRQARVIGVVRDFHFESLHQAISPMLFMIPPPQFGYNQVAVKLGGNLPAALAHLEATYARFVPNFPLNYTFLDEQFGQLYENEQRQGRLFSVFAALAIFIACLGLFGLVAFVAHQRMKEIGIRKVLGATTVNVIGLLSRDFLRLVALAFVLATPVAWWLMHRWLENFAYRTGLSWWIFGAAGLAAVLIALATVSAHGVKAALMNPVRSLRE